MAAPEPTSQLNNLPDSPLQSNPSVDSNELVQSLAQEFENLVLASKGEGFGSGSDSGFDRDVERNSGGNYVEDRLNHDDDEVEVTVDGEIEAESVNGGGEESYREVRDEVIERKVDREECRVSELGETGEDGIGGGNEDDDGEDRGYEHVEDVESEEKEKHVDDRPKGGYHYPLRPDAEDCSYYMRTGMCKYGSNCKFNHPLRRKHQQPNKETQKQKEENMEMHGQIECKYYLSPAGCKYGKSCKFSHGRGKTAMTAVVEYNFLGLPIRPGEKECPYYMRNGSCKYGPNCRFNHPDPSAVGDAPATYGNDGPLPLQPPPQPNIPSMPTWSGPRAPDPTATFVPVMYPAATQNIPPPSPDWNGYQAPAPVPPHVYQSSERGLPIPPAFFLNNPPSDTNMYTHQQQPMIGSEYPERPGQPDCSYFMKTGDCKYRASCKFHHPKSRITRTTPSVLSDKGLPLRPDQNICTYYSRYGICKYGPACKYDHPVNYNISSMPAGEGYDGSDRPGPLIQQSV